MKMLKLLAIMAIAINLTACGAEIIDTGHRGVKTRFGEIQGEPLPEGLYFYNPFTTSIVEIDTRLRQRTYNIDAYTRDVQQASMGIAVTFSFNAEHVSKVYATVGGLWEQTLLADLIPDAVKNVIGRYEAVELISLRDKVAPEVVAQLKSRIADKAKERGLPVDAIAVGSFALTDIQFTKEFEQAVEAKVTAVQNAEQERNRTVQVTEKAKQDVIKARAEAEAMTIKNQSLAQNKALIEYEAVLKWDGKLPQYMMGSSVPFVNIK